jgi:hypothetical protein
MDSGRQDRSEVQIRTRRPVNTPNLEPMSSRSTTQPDRSLAVLLSPRDVRPTAPHTIRHSCVRRDSWEGERADGLEVIEYGLEEDGLQWRERWCFWRLFTLERLGVDRDIGVSSASTCRP